MFSDISVFNLVTINSTSHKRQIIMAGDKQNNKSKSTEKNYLFSENIVLIMSYRFVIQVVATLSIYNVALSCKHSCAKI